MHTNIRVADAIPSPRSFRYDRGVPGLRVFFGRNEMPRLRIPLRLLLALPLCVAAFYLGWSNRESHLRGQYERNQAVAEKLRLEMFRELSFQRSANAAALNDAIDQSEHLQRMNTYDRLLRDPAGGQLDRMRPVQ